MVPHRISRHNRQVGSSIGHIGQEPVASSSGRLRGFLTDVLDKSTLADFSGKFDAYRARVMKPGAAQDRLSLRVVCRNDLLDGLPGLEAAIPLNEDFAIAYLGANGPARVLQPQEAERLDELRRSASHKFGAHGGADFASLIRRSERAASRGYVIDLVDSPHERATLLVEHGPALASLLSTFGYDEAEVEGIVRDTANLIGIARYQSHVVGVAVAETVTVPLRGNDGNFTIRIAELTDSSIEEAHTGSSLQVLIHIRLIEALLDRASPIDIIFSESTYGASLHGAAVLGRTFAGRLPNHATIVIGPTDHSPARYQSLEVTYMTIPAARTIRDVLSTAGRA